MLVMFFFWIWVLVTQMYSLDGVHGVVHGCVVHFYVYILYLDAIKTRNKANTWSTRRPSFTWNLEAFKYFTFDSCTSTSIYDVWDLSK